MNLLIQEAEMKNKKRKEKPVVPGVCPMRELKDKNDLFMLSHDNWNTQDNRTFIMNADFRQMNSARDDR